MRVPLVFAVVIVLIRIICVLHHTACVPNIVCSAKHCVLEEQATTNFKQARRLITSTMTLLSKGTPTIIAFCAIFYQLVAMLFNLINQNSLKDIPQYSKEYFKNSKSKNKNLPIRGIPASFLNENLKVLENRISGTMENSEGNTQVQGLRTGAPETQMLHFQCIFISFYRSLLFCCSRHYTRLLLSSSNYRSSLSKLNFD